MSGSPEVLVVGEALVDLLMGEDTRRPFACPGGSPANTAIALTRLGTPAALAARFGDDHFGDLLLSNLAANDVDLSYRVEADEPASLAVVSLDADGSACYRFHVAGTADWAWTPDELPARLPGTVQAVHTGSLAVAMTPGADVLGEWFTRQHAERTTSFDPNIRPALAGPRKHYLPRLEALVTASDIVKVSHEDLAWAYPEQDPLRVAERWRRELATTLVVVTLGSGGAFALHNSGTVHRPAVSTSIVDTVGAGDTFSAGMLHWLARHDRLARHRLVGLTESELADAVDYATAAAGVTCTRPGADPPHAGEVDRVLASVPA
ncbi:MAG: carbohydrate kinase [Actinophytocola sp.]|nr:carbohydrate kinase [Actinophytocola sp.]